MTPQTEPPVSGATPLPMSAPALTGLSVRSGGDRCPGALRPFAADDGLIVRARVPGGEVPVDVLRVLLRIGADHGTPRVQLTTRGNLQVRGLPDPMPDDVALLMADAGLLPSLTHERARNILAAPTNAVLRSRARDLDRLLMARPALAAVPGRFLMLLTDASGLGLGERFDVAYVDGGDGTGTLLLGREVSGGAGSGPGSGSGVVASSGSGSVGAGFATSGGLVASERGNIPASSAQARSIGATPLRVGLGRAVASADALEALLDVAERFLAERADERVWNIRDLPDSSPLLAEFSPVEVPGDATLRPGAYGDDLVVGVPLGLLEAQHLDALQVVSDRVVVTPWRSVLVPGGAAYADELTRAGLTVDADSPWARISACTGAPYCGRAESETLNLARESAAALGNAMPRLHLVGCGRRCGEPRGEHVTVVGAQNVADVRAAIDG